MGEVEIKVHLFAKAKELAGGRDFLVCVVQAADASISCQDFLDRYVYTVSRSPRQLARRVHPRAASPPGGWEPDRAARARALSRLRCLRAPASPARSACCPYSHPASACCCYVGVLLDGGRWSQSSGR